MRNTTRLLNVIDRALTGPVISENEFDLKRVAGGIKKAIQKYEIKIDSEHIVNQDDELADRVWEAALDFLAECGVFCTSTGRIIEFSRGEIEEILRFAPGEVLIGEGTDACVERHREVEDPQPPLIMGGPIGTPLPEDLYVPIIQSYAQEPIIDCITGGFLSTVHGRENRTRSPLEILAAWEEYDFITMAIQRAGRPGISVGCVQMSVSDLGNLSAISRGGYRPTDHHMIALIGEMKTDFELLNKVAHSLRQGGVLHALYNPIYGGLCGGMEGMAVLLVAGKVACNLIYMSANHSSSPTHPFTATNTNKEIITASSLAEQAILRNSNLISILAVTPVAGPGTACLLYECTAFTTACTVSGISIAFGVRSAAGVHEARVSGLEARFNGEVARGATRLNRESADEMVKKALEVCGPLQAGKPIGNHFTEIYDLTTILPKDDWRRVYEEVKEDISGWGLPLE